MAGFDDLESGAGNRLRHRFDDRRRSDVVVAAGENQGVDPNTYTDPIDKLSAKYLTDPNATFRFDASDLMPAAVGAGSEWHELTALFGSGKSVDAVAKAIDESWPS